MPIAIIQLGEKVSDEVKSEIAKEAMKLLSEIIGKPIAYCASQVYETIGGLGGEVGPSAFIDIRSIGGLKGKQKDLADKFCTMIESKTSIKGNKIYMNFTELTGENWGFNHKSF